MSYILLIIIIHIYIYTHLCNSIPHIFFSSNDDYMSKSLLDGEWLAKQALSHYPNFMKASRK